MFEVRTSDFFFIMRRFFRSFKCFRDMEGVLGRAADFFISSSIFRIFCLTRSPSKSRRILLFIFVIFIFYLIGLGQRHLKRISNLDL